MSGSERGLVQKRPPDGYWYVRRVVPKDLREQVGGPFHAKREVIRSLGTNKFGSAKGLARDFWREWDAEFAHARALGSGPALVLADVLAAIDRWRRLQVSAATDLGQVRDRPLFLGPVELPIRVSLAPSQPIKVDLKSLAESPVPRSPVLGSDAAAVSQRYFTENPTASRELDMPYATGVLLSRLQVAARDPDAWREIPDFDERMEGELADFIVTPLPPRLHAAARSGFADAWLEVERSLELVRQRAAAILRAELSLGASAEGLRLESAPRTYVPREGDRTVSELIDAFKKDRRASYGGESTERKYRHIWSALEVAIGPSKPIRAITREDCRRVRDLIRTVPAHMGKRYPGLSMPDAVDRAAEDEAELLAPNSVNSYLSNLIAVLNWAVREEWLERNPASGLVEKDLPLLKRRGFTPSELDIVFGGLADERELGSWKWWIPAIGLWTGARLNEICQLRTDDVGDVGGVHFITFSVFDARGRRVADKRLKTRSSARNVPIHPDLVAAGFVEFAKGRAAAGAERLFGELKAASGGEYSRGVSRWFAGYLDKVKLSDPALSYHAFRHGWRDACDVGNIPDPLIRALGGWAATSVAEKYGSRGQLPVLDREMRKVGYGPFSLCASPSGDGSA